MSTAKWSLRGGGVESVLTTTLNSVAHGSYVLSAAFDNGGSELWPYALFQLDLGSAVTAGSGFPHFDLLLIYSIDGTNYATTNGGSTAGNTAIQYMPSGGVVAPPASTNVQRLVFPGVVLLPFSFKVLIRNLLGVTLPASGNVLSMQRYSEQAV